MTSPTLSDKVCRWFFAGGKMRKTLWVLLVALILNAPGRGHGQATRGPSTPEERARFVAIAQKMEQSPLDPGLRPEREWALFWLIQVPDVTVNVCTAPLGDFLKKKYKYSPEIVMQVTFSSGQFIIEHPDQAKDANAQIVAGVEGALRAYQSILKAKPDAKSKDLDDLIQKQSQGTLNEYVRDAAGKACQGSSAGHS
jgi:hypothetical protein